MSSAADIANSPSASLNGGSGREGTIYGWWLIWGRCLAAAVAFKHWSDYIQRLALPEGVQQLL
jgi:hypothetical protein